MGGTHCRGDSEKSGKTRREGETEETTSETEQSRKYLRHNRCDQGKFGFFNDRKGSRAELDGLFRDQDKGLRIPTTASGS